MIIRTKHAVYLSEQHYFNHVNTTETDTQRTPIAQLFHASCHHVVRMLFYAHLRAEQLG